MPLIKNERLRSRLLSDRVWAWVLGVGLVLFVIHNPLLIHRQGDGKVDIFLPTVGFVISAAAIVIKLPKWENIKLGSRWVWIPLLVICLCILLSGITNAGPYAGDFYQYVRDMIAPGIFALYFFGLYVMGRNLGTTIFKPFAWAVIIGTLGIIFWQIFNPGVRTGGYVISPTNYDIGAALLVFGAVVAMMNRQWVLLTVAMIGVALTGAEEGWFAIGVVALVMLIRRDISIRSFVTVGVIALTFIVITPLGITRGLYQTTINRVETVLNRAIPEDAVINEIKPGQENHVASLDEVSPLEYATGYRLGGNWHLSSIKPFGHGLNLTDFYESIPHNIILIIIEQVGPIAALAWLFVVIYCLVKTRWKYAWVTVLSLGILDHYIWTQAAPWFWVLVGVSTNSDIETDLIYKPESKTADQVYTLKEATENV